MTNGQQEKRETAAPPKCNSGLLSFQKLNEHVFENVVDLAVLLGGDGLRVQAKRSVFAGGYHFGRPFSSTHHLPGQGEKLRV